MYCHVNMNIYIMYSEANKLRSEEDFHHLSWQFHGRVHLQTGAESWIVNSSLFIPPKNTTVRYGSRKSCTPARSSSSPTRTPSSRSRSPRLWEVRVTLCQFPSANPPLLVLSDGGVTVILTGVRVAPSRDTYTNFPARSCNKIIQSYSSCIWICVLYLITKMGLT